MIKGRENRNKAIVKLKQPSSDLLVCFPTRVHLTLMPKPIFSPSRTNNEPIKRHNQHLKRINGRVTASSSHGPDSPLIWAKDNQIRGGGPEMSEPTSPKVTCAGQIKVRPRSSSNNVSSCRNWQSVMEEIEKIHSNSKNKKKSSSLVQPFGFKTDVMNFLTCLRNVKFDFQCFGSFPQQDLSSDDDDDEEDGNYEEEDSFEEIIDNNNNNDDDEKGSDGNIDNNAVFSKWYMVLQENQSNDDTKRLAEQETGNDDSAPAVPPPNALMLMRCRSAPAKSWLEEVNEEKDKEESKEEEKIVEEEKEEKVNNTNTNTNTNTNKKKRETLAIVMKYDSDFYKLSNDIAQETWVVGEIKGPLSRSRSWRR